MQNEEKEKERGIEIEIEYRRGSTRRDKGRDRRSTQIERDERLMCVAR